MNSTAFFWVAWFLVSSWVLKEFYFSPSVEKISKLRRVAFGVDLSVLILFFLPWLPESQGGFSGWQLILQGNYLVSALLFLIAFSTLSFLTQNSSLLKTTAATHVASSVLFIGAMISIMPGTVALTLYSVSPIVASLLLLTGNVVVLLLWQQLQLQSSEKKRK